MTSHWLKWDLWIANNTLTDNWSTGDLRVEGQKGRKSSLSKKKKNKSVFIDYKKHNINPTITAHKEKEKTSYKGAQYFTIWLDRC